MLTSWDSCAYSEEIMMHPHLSANTGISKTMDEFYSFLQPRHWRRAATHFTSLQVLKHRWYSVVLGLKLYNHCCVHEMSMCLWASLASLGQTVFGEGGSVAINLELTQKDSSIKSHCWYEMIESTNTVLRDPIASMLLILFYIKINCCLN